MSDSMDYKKAGVDIDTADQTKKQMSRSLRTENSRVLNSLGAFASLYDFSFPDIPDPVLVLKMEEPGSKQLLAASHGRLATVGYDLVNHLINDTIMMGARPLAILDTIVCGKLEKEIVLELVEAMADACRREGCDLVGGETSEQPRVLPGGSYILSAASAGVVSRRKIIDGSKISEGDAVLAVASNGVHTNGYTMIRSLLEKDPELAERAVEGMTFLDAVLLPHLCYNSPLQAVFADVKVNGLAHITGGGIRDNTRRIMPEALDAFIDLEAVEVLPVFAEIQRAGNVPHDDMLRTFNMGVGLVIVAPDTSITQIQQLFSGFGFHAYQIGEIKKGSGMVHTTGQLDFTE